MAIPADRAQSLQRAVRILECFTQDRPELGVREAARLAEMPSSVTGRLMVAMRDLGILSQNPLTRAYTLGPRVLEWAGAYLSNSDLRNLSMAHMRELHQSTQETVSLYQLEGLERVCIERLESPQTVRFVAPRVGRHLPLHAGAAGKVMLAYLPADRQNEYLTNAPLERLTEHTITDPELLRKEIAEIRIRGFAVSRGEWIQDACGIAAPIFDRNGDIQAALNLSGPALRFTDDLVARLAIKVLRAASAVSAALGYRQPHHFAENNLG